MTIGVIMYYGGLLGILAGGILLLILSKIFAKQRQKMKNNINFNQLK